MLQNAETLKDKRSHLRSGVKKFMNDFYEATIGLEGINSCVFSGDTTFYLCCGYDEIKTGPGLSIDYSADYHFSGAMSIYELREFCERLPEALAGIQSKIDQEISGIDELLTSKVTLTLKK